MLPQKMQMQPLFIILVLFVHGSAASAQHHVMDSAGMMPEITVTATRYEHEDEAWLGMIDGIVVEAQRLPVGKDATISEMNSGNIPANISGGDTVFTGTIAGLLGTFTLILVMISIMYVSLRALLIAEEVEHERTRDRS